MIAIRFIDREIRNVKQWLDLVRRPELAPATNEQVQAYFDASHFNESKGSSFFEVSGQDTKSGTPLTYEFDASSQCEWIGEDE